MNSEWERELREAEFDKWLNDIEPLLNAKVSYDLGGSGQYFDDDIGCNDFNLDVDIVVEEMTKTLWDCYNDNIGDIVTEELGSEFKDTI